MKIPLFYSDLFIEKNIGSITERKELLSFISSVESEIKNKHKPLSKKILHQLIHHKMHRVKMAALDLIFMMISKIRGFQH